MIDKKKVKKSYLTADKLIFINLCKVTSEDGWGASLDGVGTPVYIVENSETGIQIAFLRSMQGDVVVYFCPDADAIDRYIQHSALVEFNRLTGQEIDTNYLSELIRGAMHKDSSDFEYENDLETLLLEGEENLDDANLNEVKNCFGVWILLRDSMDIKIDIENKSLLLNEKEFYQSIEELFDDMFGNSEQVSLIIKNNHF
jgi:hypothetical protein